VLVLACGVKVYRKVLSVVFNYYTLMQVCCYVVLRYFKVLVVLVLLCGLLRHCKVLVSYPEQRIYVSKKPFCEMSLRRRGTEHGAERDVPTNLVSSVGRRVNNPAASRQSNLPDLNVISNKAETSMKKKTFSR
jgi:hypothetical protein